MEAQKLSLLPLLSEIHALELPAAQLLALYPLAFLACATSALAYPQPWQAFAPQPSAARR